MASKNSLKLYYENDDKGTVAKSAILGLYTGEQSVTYPRSRYGCDNARFGFCCSNIWRAKQNAVMNRVSTLP
jgi:hypothetical protein